MPSSMILLLYMTDRKDGECMARIITDEELLAAVLTHKTYAAAARELGCSKNTITRRLQDKDLYSRLIDMRKDVLSVLNQHMISKGTEAIDTVYDVMKNSESDSIRLNAANAFLSYMRSLIEDEAIMDEIRKMQIADKMRNSDES